MLDWVADGSWEGKPEPRLLDGSSLIEAQRTSRETGV